MANKRKGKVLYNLWLDKEDAEGIEETIELDNYLRTIGRTMGIHHKS